MPLIIVGATAGFGGLVGTYLQDRSFRKNALFQVKLNAINADKEQVREIRRDIDEARRKIASNETESKRIRDRVQNDPKLLTQAESFYCVPDYQGPYADILREAAVRLDSLRQEPVASKLDGEEATVDQTFAAPSGSRSGSNAIDTAIDESIHSLRAYVDCLDDDGCTSCSSDGVVESVDKVLAAHTEAARRLLNEAD